MNKSILITIVVIVILLTSVIFFHQGKTYNLKLEKLKNEHLITAPPSINHNKLSALNKDFKTPQEVTAACILCHTERHKEIIASSHWNWERIAYVDGRGITGTGKKNVINNFCVGASSNEQSCAKCHIGFGMTNNKFDFNNAKNVDCMVCHDNSEEYLKGLSMAGYPDRTINLKKVAQSVGIPKKSNCGACHFYGGGGNNVKHGDLEESLLACEKSVDVHMASNGMDMSCVACHTAQNHVMKGRLYSVSSDSNRRSTCEQCHTATPHSDELLNEHITKVACQTCHIPVYAKVNATNTEWLWSEAGKLRDGEPYHEEDKDGNHTYLSIKGSLKWSKNVKPEYVWFNGTANNYILGDTIKSEPVVLNPLNGSYDDENSKIIPVKVHRGDQIYDKKHNILIQPKLWGKQKGEGAYWKDFDWDIAIKSGMKEVGLPYSGEYGFIETEMYWPINHMVSPKEESLTCSDCHTRKNGRLASLTNFYLPGRDRSDFLDTMANIIIILTILGVFIHSVIRINVAKFIQFFNNIKRKSS